MDQTAMSQVLIQFANRITSFYDYRSSSLQFQGMTSVQIRMLHYIYDHEGCSQQAIVDMRKVSRSTISSVINQMIRHDLVYRTGDDEDRRLNKIYLTSKGKKIAEEVAKEFDDYCAILIKSLTKAQVERLHDLLEKVLTEVE